MNCIKRLPNKRHLGNMMSFGRFECPICQTIVDRPLRDGKRAKSCSRECNKKVISTHGMKGTKEYAAYYNAKHRCTYPNAQAWSNYGGRGIQFRIGSFEEFYKEVGPAPTKEHELDRIDNNGHYELGNLQWSTKSQQARNKRLPKRDDRTGRFMGDR